MKTICLRFSDAYAPSKGTIQLHQEVIDEKGFVWYGKRSNKINQKYLKEILENGPAKILLLKAGGTERYWATLEDFSYDKQSIHPSYYSEYISDISTWLKITKIERADDNVADKCLTSTGKTLSSILKKTFGAYFVIEYKDE